MFDIAKNIVFDELDKDTQESLKILGFKEGDNLSEIFQDFLDKREVTLDEYLEINFKKMQGGKMNEFNTDKQKSIPMIKLYLPIEDFNKYIKDRLIEKDFEIFKDDTFIPLNMKLNEDNLDIEITVVPISNGN